MAGDTHWFYWALWSAVFAASRPSSPSSGSRASIPIYVTGKWSNPLALAPNTWLFLVLSGLATGTSWLCYFRALKVGDASKVAPVDKLSLVLVAVSVFSWLEPAS